MANALLTGPRYRQRLIPAGGLNLVPGAKAKLVLHTTETGPGSADNIINAWWHDPGRGMPNFWGNFPNDIIQTISINQGAYTLENPPGGIDTNRGGVPCVQIEICEYAKNAPVWGAANAEWSWVLAEFIADLVEAGVDLLLENQIDWKNNNRARIAGGDWYAFNGVLGHRDAPEQPGGHWDPGGIDGEWIINTANLILAIRRGEWPDTTPPPPPTPPKDGYDMASIEDLKGAIREVVPELVRNIIESELNEYQPADVVMQLDNKLFRMIRQDDGSVMRRYITADEWAGLQEAKQVRSGPWVNVTMQNEGWFRSLPHIPVMVDGKDVTPF